MFQAVPWSHGTLGFLVAAEIRIVPASKYVKVQYHPAHSSAALVQMFTEKSMERSKHQFVEGIVYSRNSGVVMTGTMTDTAEPDLVGTEEGKVKAVAQSTLLRQSLPTRSRRYYRSQKPLVTFYRGRKLNHLIEENLRPALFL